MVAHKRSDLKLELSSYLERKPDSFLWCCRICLVLPVLSGRAADAKLTGQETYDRARSNQGAHYLSDIQCRLTKV
jgi:hypothetical protein